MVNSKKAKHSLDPQVLYQDKDLIVVNKPAGIVVNRSNTLNEETLQDWMEAQLNMTEALSQGHDLVPSGFTDKYGSPEEIFERRGGIAHRLDRETSGALILAKNPGALVHLLGQFKKRLVQKMYIALVHGHIRAKKARINVPIARYHGSYYSGGFAKFCVSEQGRKALTKYEVQEEFDYQASMVKIQAFVKTHVNEEDYKYFKKKKRTYQQGFSLVHCFPKTGRTHQIRVHLSHLQHALVGDKVYGGKKRSRLDKMWCPRHFLHAKAIKFTHPRTNAKIQVKSDLVEDLEEVISLVEGN